MGKILLVFYKSVQTLNDIRATRLKLFIEILSAVKNFPLLLVHGKKTEKDIFHRKKSQWQSVIKKEA